VQSFLLVSFLVLLIIITLFYPCVLVTVHCVVEFLPHSFTQGLSFHSFLIWILRNYLRLRQHFEILRISDHLALLDGPLLGRLLLLWRHLFSQVLDYHSAVVDSTNDILDVVPSFKLALRERAF